MELRPRRVEVAIDGLPGARLWIDGGSRETARQSLVMPLAPDSVTSARLFIVAPGEGPAPQDFTIAARPLDNDQIGIASCSDSVCPYFATTLFAVPLKKKKHP